MWLKKNKNMKLSDILENDPDFRPWNMDLSSYCMLMHLSQFAGIIVPFGGIALPIIMWATNKDKSSIIDQHGKNILNWMISFYIYVSISAILILLIIGIFALITLCLVAVIFAIIGAIKANNKEIFNYPLSITFIK
jgi:uncharacterized Tic20 family protein